jgi:hypothetical protein
MCQFRERHPQRVLRSLRQVLDAVLDKGHQRRQLVGRRAQAGLEDRDDTLPGARGGRPKLQRPQCRRHGGRRRDRQSPDTPADVTAARQERLVTAQAARGARLPAGLLRQGRRELSVLLRAIGLVLHDDSVGWEPKEHQHISRLSGFRVAVLRVAFGHDDRRLREELCDDQTRQPGRRRIARIVPSA